jgi:hypothetical protein
VHLHRVGACAGVGIHLVDPDGQFAGDRGDHLFFRPDHEGLRNVRVADATNHRAAPDAVLGQDANQILEIPRQPFRAVVLFGVGIAQRALRGYEYRLTPSFLLLHPPNLYLRSIHRDL